jgi:hypothetical protein
VLLRKRLLDPRRYGFYAVVLFSHKVARRLAPVALVAVAVSSTWLASQSFFFRVLAFGQAAFYGAALIGWMLRRARLGGSKVLYIPLYYCMANAASALALLDVARGKRIAMWKPQRQPAR